MRLYIINIEKKCRSAEIMTAYLRILASAENYIANR